MIIITSPAKTLDFEREFDIDITKAEFLSETSELVSKLRKYSVSELEKLFGVSRKIAELNYERFKIWEKSHTKENSKPAISAYDGDIYKQLDYKKYSNKQWSYLSKHLRIPSGLYGLLRASDLIQPYRLEMSTKLPVEGKENLYEFWGEKLTKSLNQEIEKNGYKYLVNLASDEYAKAINFEKLDAEVISIEFRQRKNGELKNYGILAKKARGKMINFMAMNSIENLKKLKEFDQDGYEFMKEEENSIFFVKDKK